LPFDFLDFTLSFARLQDKVNLAPENRATVANITPGKCFPSGIMNEIARMESFLFLKIYV
jgi:hypothetical protein